MLKKRGKFLALKRHIVNCANEKKWMKDHLYRENVLSFLRVSKYALDAISNAYANAKCQMEK